MMASLQNNRPESMHGQITFHHNKLRIGCHCTAPEHRSDLGQLRSHGLRQRVIHTRHRLTRHGRRRILSRQPRPGRRHGRRRRWRWRGDVLPSVLAVELGVHRQAASNNTSIKPRSVNISLRTSAWLCVQKEAARALAVHAHGRAAGERAWPSRALLRRPPTVRLLRRRMLGRPASERQLLPALLQPTAEHRSPQPIKNGVAALEAK